VTMRVVPVSEWEAQLADVVRHLVGDDEASGAPLVGMPSAATK
jgi:hypothetical protein